MSDNPLADALRSALKAAADEIDSLRTQLEEQKALVAGVVEGLVWIYELTPLNWRELLFKKIVRLKTGFPSAQQDAAILKAAREISDALAAMASAKSPWVACASYYGAIDSLCKAVRGGKDAPTG